MINPYSGCILDFIVSIGHLALSLTINVDLNQTFNLQVSNTTSRDQPGHRGLTLPTPHQTTVSLILLINLAISL